MNLFEMKPKESRLKLKALKKELVLNPITLSDEAWLDDAYGAEKVTEIFEQVNIKEISRIVYRLLNNESKSLFKKQMVTFIDENGDSAELELGGVELLRTMISGWEEKLALLNALLENIGASRPEITDTNVKKKKKRVTRKKKR